MTVAELWGALRRRWLVMLFGLFLTLAVCLLTARLPGVYWASTKVYLLVPASAVKPNQLIPADAAIDFAGLIEAEVNHGVPARQATSPDVTLVDQGIYDGWSVLQPDTGGQWAHNFTESSLIVQASGPTAAIVQTRMDNLIHEIVQLATAHENSAHVAADERVELTMSPGTVAVQYSNGNHRRALEIIVLLGVGLSLAACGVADRAYAARRRRGDTSDSIGDARVRDAAGGDQDGPGREGVDAPPDVTSDRGGDRAAPGDAGPGQRGVRDRSRS